MVKVKEQFPRHEDESLDVDLWLQQIKNTHQLENIDLIKKSCELAATSGKGLTTFYGQACAEQGMEIAEILLDLHLDSPTIAAGVILSTTQYSHSSPEHISKHLGEDVAKLVDGVLQMNNVNLLSSLTKNRDQTQIDRLRKMVLAMASDIRVVIIKLAERMVLLRGIKNINSDERKRLAEESMDIYAPLANRLGIGQLKWELEDLAFHYLNPETYKKIASFLVEKRIDREKGVKQIISQLKKLLADANISAEISGRAKHIYSIYRKSQNKQREYKDIFDYSAARIIVPTIQDCYTTLSIVHDLWEQIPEEFDDYITHPKPNGYRSIHTAVMGLNEKNLEIQIRTKEMHEQAEHGVAAHWLYKENNKKTGYEDKITYLRQLLAWQHDITKEEPLKKGSAELFADRVYVFTPAGDVFDLPMGATPLDFAYHIHSELGHRCRGGKVNGHIVTLKHTLQTGDQVEILTVPIGAPSRDWLNPEHGYLKTSRARAKVAQWFRHQETNQYVEAGKQTLEKEFAKLGVQHINLHKVATRFGFKTDEAFLSSVGHGSIRISQVLHAIHTEQKLGEAEAALPLVPLKRSLSPKAALEISGVDHLLTRIAKCCKPIPGDQILGFITQGRGVSIHRKDCYNISHIMPDNQSRLITVTWDEKQSGSYYVDLYILAYAGENVLKDVSNLFSTLKINLVALNSTLNQKTNMIHITLTVQINDASQLEKLIHQIHPLPNVVEVKRISE